MNIILNVCDLIKLEDDVLRAILHGIRRTFKSHNESPLDDEEVEYMVPIITEAVMSVLWENLQSLTDVVEFTADMDKQNSSFKTLTRFKLLECLITFVTNQEDSIELDFKGMQE